MREIKFRAWDETNKVMENDVNVNQGKAVKYGYQWFNAGNTVYDSELMQYTGLKDKNGKEIYEGDIVLCDRNINDAFDKTTFLIGIDEYFRYQGVSKLGNEISVEEFKCAEVLGNIYEQEVE